MSQKFTFINSEGFPEESAGAFEVSDHISTSAGVADASKPVITDGTGQLDGSLINVGSIDHGGLAGLADDDHTIYIKADGTRAFTGSQSMGGNTLTNLADASGSTDALPLGQMNSTANGKGASLVGIEDAAGYFTGTNVEAVLAEIYAENTGHGVSYAAATGGVTKGDLCYITGNDEAGTMSLSTNSYAVGLADATVSAGTPFMATPNDHDLAGVLTAATAGTRYYWDGTGHSTSIPAGGGSYVWQTGIAKNATDLAVEIQFLKKNS